MLLHKQKVIQQNNIPNTYNIVYNYIQNHANTNQIKIRNNYGYFRITQCRTERSRHPCR